MIIKYDANGVVEWAQSMGGSSSDQITSVAETNDGGYIVGGYFGSSIITVGNDVNGNPVELTNAGNQDGMIIKYDENGNVEWAQSIGGSNGDYINSVAGTSDGGYIVGGYFGGYRTEAGYEVDLGNNVSLISNGYYDGMLIKYDANGYVEWAQSIGGSDDDSINSVASTSDGGCIVGGKFESSIIDLENGVSLRSGGAYVSGYNNDGMIIKYNSTGIAQWARTIGRYYNDEVKSIIETTNGTYLVGGYFSEIIDLENGSSLASNNYSNATDGMIIIYNPIQKPEIITKHEITIGGTDNDRILNLIETRDGGYLVGGYFSESVDLGNGEILTSNGNTDGIIVKYNINWEVQWAKTIGGSKDDLVKTMIETSDGGYLVGGHFESKTISLENEVNLKNSNSIYTDGMLIKYDENGYVEWAKSIGGYYDEEINSVAETSDGGYIVGGYFGSSSITVGNDVSGKPVELTSTGDQDGMLIKYDIEGKVKWAKAIGIASNHIDMDTIKSIVETEDGGYLVVGESGCWSGEAEGILDLGNGIILICNAYTEGIIIKYDKDGNVQFAKLITGTNHDRVSSVAETNDGGFIVGVYSQSDTVNLGDGVNYIMRGQSNLIVKYNNKGTLQWVNESYGEEVFETKDGGYIVKSYSNVTKYSYQGTEIWSVELPIGISNVIETSNNNYLVGGSFKDSIALSNLENLTSKGNDDGIIVKITEEMGVPEVQELVVENTIKQFQITTDVVEIDGEKGGSISGENSTPYETVEYNQNNTKEIKITPDTGYEIINITVNGEEYPLPDNTENEYTFPVFTNVKEDIHIEVTFAQSTQKISILKRDGNTKIPLEGVTFKLDQIEERTEPGDVIGEITPNGETYVELDIENEVTSEVLGTLTNNESSEYIFVQNSDGTLIPTNGKTYQLANEGTGGIHDTTANSYIPINLGGKEGNYVVVVNAEVSSENNCDFGYATINTSATTIPI